MRLSEKLRAESRRSGFEDSADRRRRERGEALRAAKTAAKERRAAKTAAKGRPLDIEEEKCRT